MIFGNDGTSLL